MNQVHIDWERIHSADEFYDVCFYQLGAPEWHGRSLDALNDSLIAGGINRNDVPYHFILMNHETDELKDFRDALIEVMSLSVSDNGGLLEVRK